MVNKMNLKPLFLGLLLSGLLFYTPDTSAKNQINQRQYVACGISQDYKSLAYKQDNHWYGFDADICRAIAAAFLGDPERFKLIPVKKENIGQALNSAQIDIMLGNSSFSASEEAKFFVTPVDTLYYDRQIFASRQTKNATSMHDYKNTKVCVLRNSNASAFLNEYNQKYALGFKILEMPSLIALKEAFYINRCELVSGSEIFIKDIVSNVNATEKAEILPEEITYIPIKAYTAGNNPSLNIAVRWIINALKLAASANITSQNIDTFNATKSKSLQNLIGTSSKTWTDLGIEPLWIKKFIPLHGNYLQILDRNIGSISKLNLDIKQNDMIENGGFLISHPFI